MSKSESGKQLKILNNSYLSPNLFGFLRPISHLVNHRAAEGCIIAPVSQNERELGTKVAPLSQPRAERLADFRNGEIVICFYFWWKLFSWSAQPLNKLDRFIFCQACYWSNFYVSRPWLCLKHCLVRVLKIWVYEIICVLIINLCKSSTKLEPDYKGQISTNAMFVVYS